MKVFVVAVLVSCASGCIRGSNPSVPAREVYRPSGNDLTPAMRVTNNYKLKTQGKVRAGVDDIHVTPGRAFVRFCFEPVNGEPIHLLLEELTLEVRPEGPRVSSDHVGRVSSRDELKWVKLSFRIPQPPLGSTYRLTLPIHDSDGGSEIVQFDFSP